jgi:putative transposase
MSIKQSRDGMPAAEIFRKAGIHPIAVFNWEKRHGELLPIEILQLQQLEDENATLKKLVADLCLHKEMLQELIRRKL